MPQIANGCGTWYYGKRNLIQYPGVCSACGAATTLSSYDTRLYVVFVMIPILPLRRRRILDHCPVCTRHRSMPIVEWQLAEGRMREAAAAWRQTPRDDTLTKELLEGCAVFRDMLLFEQVAPQIEQVSADNAEILTLLAKVYDLFGRAADAERLLRRALELDGSDETSEALGDCLLRMGRPEEAEPYLQHIVEEGIPDRVDALYQLAQAYQMKGQHEKALEIFEQCERISPQAAQDPTFIRLRDASARHAGTHVPVVPAQVARKARAAASRRRIAKAVPVALAVAALAYVVLAWWMGARREVYLVNGLSRAYTVRLNGNSYPLAPESVRKVRLGEGDVKVEIVDAPEGIAAETVSIRTPLLTRPFASHTFVLNPDGTAIVSRARVFYTPTESNWGGLEPQYSHAVGRTLHHFTQVQYPFETPPSTIQMDQNEDVVWRDVLSLERSEPEAPLSRVLLVMAHSNGKDEAARAARRHLLLEPEQSDFLYVLQVTMEPQALAEFLRPQLDRRPLLLKWHRVYQDSMTRTGRDEQQEAQYAAMLKAEPDNRDLMYLTARVTSDPVQAIALMREAATGEAPLLLRRLLHVRLPP